MQCRKCGKQVDDRDVKKVAEWSFCSECFDLLLDKSAETDDSGSADVDLSMDESAVPASEDAMKCHTCLRQIESDNYKALGIWKFCPECYENLTARPPEPEKPEPDEDPHESPEPAKKEDEVEPVDYTQSIRCGACDRIIPLGGAKPAGDHLLCPDCYYELAKRIQVQIRTSIVPGEGVAGNHYDIAGPPPDSHVSEVCSSCGKKASSSGLSEIDGFMICKACLSADRELALEIARERHQQYLRRLKRKLSD